MEFYSRFQFAFEKSLRIECSFVRDVSKQRNDVMPNEKQRNGKKIFRWR